MRAERNPYGKRQVWTAAEVERVKELSRQSPALSNLSIALEMKRSERSIFEMRYKLGIALVTVRGKGAAKRGRRNREGERRQPVESAAFVERLMAAAERAAKADRHAPLWSGARAPRRLD